MKVSALREEEGEKILEGGRAEVAIRVTNEGGPIGLLRVEDSVPRGTRVSRGSRVAYTALGRGESAGLRYSLTADAPGSWELGPVTITAEDGFGLTSESQTLNLPYRLDAIPRSAGRTRFPFRPLKTKNWPGQVTASRPGTGQDFYGIRQYLPSDPARSVNWKATARLERMYTNQYMAELGAEAVLVVDKGYGSEYGAPPSSALNYVERCAAAAASGLLLAGNRVGLVIFGDRMYEVGPSTGVRQLELLLVGIVRASKGQVRTYSYLRNYLAHFFPRAAQVIVVSSLMDADLVGPLLATGAQRDVRVITPTLFSLDPGLPRTEAGDVAMSLLRMRRSTTLERLRRWMVVSEWDVSRPVEEALERALFPRAVQRAR